ncbi:MAG: RAMP superfamily CRISPR-associated protein [Nitrospirota bacterium]|nr:RAMP superfamily CRISPR-associated protein [Nitrospirota bacterium]
MKSHYFKGELVLQSPLHLGSGEKDDYIDSLVLREMDGVPVISGTSICGIMASLAKKRLRLEKVPTENIDAEPVFKALFGSAAEERNGRNEGRESRLIVHDAQLIPASMGTSFIQDRTSINRERGSAEEQHLFHDEVISSKSRFSFSCVFREKNVIEEEKALQDHGRGPDKEAFHLFLDLLELMEKGWASIGGKTGTGHGEFTIENLKCSVFDSSNPEDVLRFVLDGVDALEQINLINLRDNLKTNPLRTSNHSGDKYPGPEVLIIEGVLRPIDPIMVKTGYSLESVSYKGSKKEEGQPIDKLQDFPPLNDLISVDSAFCLNEEGIPYLPGSSIRGCLRSHAERMVRTMIFERFKNNDPFKNDRDGRFTLNAIWDLKRLRDKGKEFKKAGFNDVYDNACIISKLFGFPAMGGRIYFSDAVPIDANKFKNRLKLLDHVAIDRFTGGAAHGKKFNSRPFYPFYEVGRFPENDDLPDDSGDICFKIEIHDFKLWHFGLVSLLLKDLHNARISVGFGKNKGFGRVKLLPGSTRMEAITHGNGVLSEMATTPTSKVGGFRYVSATIKPDRYFWISPENGILYEVVKNAVSSFREKVLEWTPENIIPEAEIK